MLNFFVGLEVKPIYWKKKVLTVSLNFENQFFFRESEGNKKVFFYFKRFELSIILVILSVSSSSIFFKVFRPLSSRSSKISFHPILLIHLNSDIISYSILMEFNTPNISRSRVIM